jgi:hypothetical protein
LVTIAAIVAIVAIVIIHFGDRYLASRIFT